MDTAHHTSVRHDGGGTEIHLPFPSRASAGRLLADTLAYHRDKDALVLGIPRGGVEVAAEIASALHAELDVAVARKLGAPGQPELAIGAITADGTRYVNEELVAYLGVTPQYMQRIEQQEQEEARRRESRFRGARAAPRVEGRTVILVDDGLATGATMFVAVDAIRRRHPALLIVAVPVGARESCDVVRGMADELVCLAQPEPFYGVGMHFEEFPQLEDSEVIRMLDEARADHGEWSHRRAHASGG